MATFKSAIRKLSRAFSAKDERAFDEALEELEEKAEEAKDEEDPIEIHNHIPDSRDSMGELPSKEFTVSGPAFDEEPEWFKKHKEANDAMMKSMKDSFEEFMKGKKKEGEAEDAEGEEESEPIERGEEGEAEDDMGNLEMEDRRKNNDRSRNNNDEANKEILGELEFEAPPGTGDAARRAKDSKYLEEAFQDAVAKAEVIVPGINLPTFDRKAPPVRTMKSIVALRRSALDLAYNTLPAARGVIDQAMSGRTMDSKRMKLGQARVLFNSVAGQIASGNNSRATDGATNLGTNNQRQAPAIQTLADMNKRNREMYATKR
jgi:hypothetical protein